MEKTLYERALASLWLQRGDALRSRAAAVAAGAGGGRAARLLEANAPR